MLFVILLATMGLAGPLTLSSALEIAEKQNKEIQAQGFQLDQAGHDIQRVSGEFGPKLEALAGVGPITRATGNSLSSSTDNSSWGRIFLGKFTLTQPLYTFGRKQSYLDAAESGLQVEQGELSVKISEVRFQVKEAYHGFQLANSFRDFIEGGKAELQKALEKRKQKSESKESYKMEIFLSEVENREAEILKYYQLAKDALALRVGIPREQLEIKDLWIVPQERKLESLEKYLAMAKENRGEFRQLTSGIHAKQRLASAEKKALLPVLVAMASYDFAHTNVRPEQQSVFAYDPYNRDSFAFGLGMKWDFQWSLAQAKSGKLGAEAMELEAKEAYAAQGIETEVRKAYLEVQEAESRLAAAKKGYVTGKKWLTKEIIGYSSGLGSSSGLAEAYGARAETTKSYFEAVHRHHMAWAALSKVVGKEVDPVVAR